MKCIVGGTFAVIHKGHERLFQAALAFDEIQIGLTEDYFASHGSCVPVPKYNVRKARLTAFLNSFMKDKKAVRKFQITKISDRFGFAPNSDANTIIVSSETESVADEINQVRASNRKRPLRIISVPLVYAKDYIKLSSSRILQGKVDCKGKRLKPVVFALGSINPSKKQGVARGARKLFGKFRIISLEAKSHIREQPFGQETMRGAENRARASYFASGADFGIGIESGLFEMGSSYYDIAVCALFDGEHTTFGTSMGFQMPQLAIDLLSHHKDLGAAMSELTGIDRIGYKKGAIHHLSAGVLSRQDMNEQAFLCAMIPRISETKGVFTYL